MLFVSIKQVLKPLSLVAITAVGAWFCYHLSEQQLSQKSYIISSTDFEQLQQELKKLQLTPTHELAIINAVAVVMTEAQLNQLQQDIKVNVSDNHAVTVSGGWRKGTRRWQPKAVVPSFIGANKAHSYGNYGDGVTIGFLDTGLDQLNGLATDLYGRDKVWGTYDAVNNVAYNYDDEVNGHGTHVASIATNSDYDIYGRVYGVAPNAAIVGIKAFDNDGKGSYADVIRGIQWALQVKEQINLKVLNMSFSGPAVSYYWEDPLNLAVMKAWQAGIVVVASAGNKGPDPMTIGVPGNVPYIITVGAMTDNYTPSDRSDDKLASFSSAGPTIEGFVKPELVAPGGHISGLMAFDSQIVIEHPDFHDGGQYFEMSGTSQATAVVSGVVALMLTDNPSLTPDQVKCRLIASANTAMKDEQQLGYSVFQQGAGVVDAAAALASSASDCANSQLDIAQDINNTQHYYGPTSIDADGNFYLEGFSDTYIWNFADNTNINGGFIWKNSVGINGGFIWKNAFITDSDLTWRAGFESNSAPLWQSNVSTDGGFIWKNNVEFDNTEAINVNSWVEQQ